MSICAKTPRALALTITALLTAACGKSPETSSTSQAVWTNGDFEGDSIGADPSGWTIGTNANPGITDLRPDPQTLASLNLAAGGAAAVTIVGGATETQADPDVGAGGTLRYPKYGQRAARINKSASVTGTGRNSNTLSQTMTISLGDVDPTDGKVHVRFAIAPVLENPGHSYTSQPYYFVRLQNLTRGTTVYQDFNASGQPGVPWKNFTDTSGQAAQYTDWQLVDVSPGNAALAVGDQVELMITASGCSAGGHWGRVYVDAVGSGIPGLYTWATGPENANDGTDITYTVNYKNGGTITASGTTIDFVTPPNTVYASTTGTGCTEPSVGSTGTISCPIGTLSNGATGAFAITVTIPSGTSTGTLITNGNYSIYATGSSALLGPKVYTTVTSGVTYADLGVTITDGTAALGWGQPTTYTVQVTNNGPVAADGAQISDPMPAQLAGVTWTCAGSGGATCTASGTGDIADTAAAFPAGGALTYTISATVVAGSGSTSMVNTVSVATAGGVVDPMSANNAAVDTDGVGTPRTLAVAVSGPGGSVVSVPSAISCGATCSGTFLDGAQVVLSAVPVTGASFLGWGGACSGAADCTVTMTGDQSVTATFVGAPASIAVSSGSPQLAAISTAFGSPLVALVTDADGTPVPGATVAFAAPGSGASATFSAPTATTNASGLAQVTAHANATAGSYAATASTAGVATPASFALTNAGVPASIATTAGSGQSAVVATAFATDLAVTVTDALSQPVANATVVFTPPATGATASLAALSAITDASGIAHVAATAGTTAGGYAVTAAVMGVATPATLSLTNLAGAPATLAVTGGASQTAIVTQAFAQSLTVRLADAYGNAIAGASVGFSAPGAGASASLTGAPATTSAAGVASASATAGTVAGSYQITASSAGVTSVTIAVANAPGAPATATVSGGDDQSTIVHTAFGAPLAVLIADAYGNPTPGIAVGFTAPASGATAAIAGATTDASGIATTSATANTVAGSYAATATASGIASPAAFTLHNLPAAPAAIAATGGGGQSATVGTAFASSIAVAVVDTYGNAVPAAAIAFTAPGSGASVATTPPDATTDAAGHASSGIVANHVAGSYAVTARVGGVATPATFALTNTAGPPAAVAITGGDAQHAVVATAFASPLAVRVADAYDNPVPAVAVAFAAPLVGAIATLAPTSVTTGVDGRASTSATAGTVTGGYAVTATSGAATTAFALTNDPGAPAAIAVVSGSAQHATVGSAFASPLVARVTDAFGNVVPAAAVTFAPPGAGATATLAPAIATTDGSGLATSAPTTNHVAGSYAITATVAAVAPASFALHNDADVIATLTRTGGDNQSTVVVTQFGKPLGVHGVDHYGNDVPGATITFASPAQGAAAWFSGGSTTATTDAGGDAVIWVVANPIVGSYATTATGGTSAPVSFSMTNLPDAPIAIAVVDGDPQETTVAQPFAAPLRVLVSDRYGNPVPNQPVRFSPGATAATATFASSTAVTDDTGRASTTATANPRAGHYTVAAQIPAAIAIFHLGNLAAAPARITAASTATPQAMTIGQPFLVALEVLVEDAFGNPVPGATVGYAPPASVATATLAATTAQTAGDGRAAITATAGLVAGAYAVTASVPGVPAPASFALANLAGPPITLVLAGGGDQRATVDTDFAAPLAVIAYDETGNPVPSAVITFAPPATGPTALLAATAAITDADGNAAVTVHAGTLAGGYHVVATLAGAAAPVAFALTNTPGAPAQIIASANSTPQATAVGTPYHQPLIATVSDAFGNPVPGAEVRYVAPTTGATGTGAASATTGVDGASTIAFTAGTIAGAFSVTASVTGVATSARFALTNLVGDSHVLAIVSGDGQHAAAGTAFAAPLVAIVTDASGNAVVGAAVTFAGAHTVATDARGHAAFTPTAGTSTGPFSITATEPGASAPVAFSLAVTAGPAATLGAVAAATPQSAHVGDAFAVPLAVAVADRFGNPVGGAIVAFAAPASPGAQLSAATATTDATGHASVVAVADATAGGYAVVATTAGTAAATFALTNLPGTASQVLLRGGGAQHALATTAFAVPLAFELTDPAGNPIAGTAITIAMPAGMTAAPTTAVSDASGMVAFALTAGPQVGSFVVSATAPGALAPATAALVVDAIPTTLALSGPTSLAIDEPATLTVTATAAIGMPTGAVTLIDAAGTSVATATLAGGMATFDLASRPLGTSALTAHYAAQGSYGASASSTLELVTLDDSRSLSGGGCDAGSGGDALPVALAIGLALLWRARRHGRAATLLVATLGTAHADDGARAVDRYHAATAESAWFSLDSVSFAGARDIVVAMVGDFAHHPLVIYNQDGTIGSSAVTESLVLHVGGSITLGDRWRLAATVPVSPYQDGAGGMFNGMALSSPTFGFGDVAVAGDVRLLGGARDRVRIAAGARVVTPTGSRSNYMSDGVFAAEPRVSVAGTEGAIEYAMTASALLRRTTALVGERFGSELRYAIGAGVRAAGGRLLVGPELQGAVSLVHDTSTGHPLELDLGAHYAASARLRFGLGLTRGLVNAVGTPDWRGLLSVAWNP